MAVIKYGLTYPTSYKNRARKPEQIIASQNHRMVRLERTLKII